MTLNYTKSALASAMRIALGTHTKWLAPISAASQRIYYANHTSHLDFVVTWASLPPGVRNQTRPVAAREYWTQGIFRSQIAQRLFRAVLVDRPLAMPRTLASRSMLDPMLHALDAGDSLILFPEGTRGDGEQVGAFKSGIYHLAQMRPNVQLVPVYLANVNRILPKGEFMPVPMLSRVVFGAPLDPLADESKETFLNRARAALCALRAQ